MIQKKSKIAKAFIFVTLIFIVFASFAVYIVMYAWFKWTDNRCKEWYFRDEEIQDCVEVSKETEEDSKIDDKETCETTWWTWYEENWICIKWENSNPGAPTLGNGNIQESIEEEIQTTNE